MINLTTKSGKYRIVQDENGRMTLFRNNEVWNYNPECPKMIIELCCELEELRDKERMQQ